MSRIVLTFLILRGGNRYWERKRLYYLALNAVKHVLISYCAEHYRTGNSIPVSESAGEVEEGWWRVQFNDIVSSFLYQHDHRRPPQVRATRPSSTVRVRCPRVRQRHGVESLLTPGFSLATGTQTAN